MSEHPETVKQFIIAVRTRARQDEVFAVPSQKSIVKLILETNSKLEIMSNRIPVLQAITGLPIKSTLQLTQVTVSVLIDEVKNADAETILYIERFLEDRDPGKGTAHVWELFPWERPTASVPDLQETSTG